MHYLFYKVNKADIYIIKFLLESYENMVQMSTIDEDLPKIQLTVAPDCLPDILGVIEDLKTKFYLQELDDDCTVSQGNY